MASDLSTASNIVELGPLQAARKPDGKPIIFSGPMIAALLAGRKSQTRRVLKLPTKGEYVRKDMGGWEPTTIGGAGVFTIARGGSHVPAPECVAIWNRTTGTCIATPLQTGDRLWVREAWQTILLDSNTALCAYRANCVGDRFTYASDGSVEIVQIRKWRSPIFMPRVFSRLTLTVTDVRVQRLREISAEDAFDEGIRFTLERYQSGGGQSGWGIEGVVQGAGPQHAYSLLWEILHGAGAWDANPWVVAYTFGVEQRNIDSGGAQ